MARKKDSGPPPPAQFVSRPLFKPVISVPARQMETADELAARIAQAVIEQSQSPSLRPLSVEQRFVARVRALRAQGRKKAVEKAAAEFKISRRTAYDWLRPRRG